MNKLTDYFVKIVKPTALLDSKYNDSQRYTRLYNMLLSLNRVLHTVQKSTTIIKTDLIIGIKGVLYTPAFLRQVASMLLEQTDGFKDFNSWEYIDPNNSMKTYYSLHMTNPPLKYISRDCIMTHQSTTNNNIIFNTLPNNTGLYKFTMLFKSNHTIPLSNRIFMTGLISTNSPKKIINDLALINAYDIAKNKNTLLLSHNTILDKIYIYAKGSRLENRSFSIQNKTDNGEIDVCMIYNSYQKTISFYYNNSHLITLDISYMTEPIYPLMSLSNLAPQCVDIRAKKICKKPIEPKLGNMISKFNISPYSL